MPSVKFSKKDFQGKTPVVPKFYKLQVKNFTEKKSKDGDSTNFWGEFAIAEEGEFNSLELRHCFSEKALEYAGGAADYMSCFTQNTEQLYDMEVLDALKLTIDKQVMGYVEWDPEFRRNQIKDWRSVS